MEKIKHTTKLVVNTFKRYFKSSVVVLVFLIVFMFLNFVSYAIYTGSITPDPETSQALSEDVDSSSKLALGDCNVLGINLQGRLDTYIPAKEPTDLHDVISSDYISYYIRQAEKDSKIKAIILEIDSLGGSPVAGEEIAHELLNAKKPTVAMIRGAGMSAAYWAATGADVIFASKNSDIGSIGVTYSYLDKVEKNKKEGLTYIELFAGQYKETGNPDKALTTGEKNLIIRDLKIMHNNFIKAVSENRKISFEKVSILADGSSMLGDQAKKSGLIDRIGDRIDVEAYLSEKIGEKSEICWY